MRVEFFRIEEHGQAVILVNLQLAIVEDPFAIAQHAVYAPVDEHAEFHVLKFAAGLQVLGGRLIARLSAAEFGNKECKGKNESKLREPASTIWHLHFLASSLPRTGDSLRRDVAGHGSTE